MEAVAFFAGAIGALGGAIAVIALRNPFYSVLALVVHLQEPAWEPIPGQQFIAPLLGGALFVELSIAVLGSSLKPLDSDGPTIPLGFGSPADIGRVLLERFLIAFEAASMLLLLAAVGAVVLAGRRRSGEERGGGTPSERFAHEAPGDYTETTSVSGRAASEEGGAAGPTTPGHAY